jgi:peptidoglycan/xylan/chitin deacetylase (PgdA/CDA1 family)
MKAPRLSRLLAVPCLVALVVAPTVVATARARATIAVRVGRQVYEVRRGTTLQQLVGRFHIQTPTGSLRAVDGTVLKAGISQGRLLFNSRTPPGGLKLRAGDVITLVPGKDRTEPTVRDVIKTDGGPTNPQFSLGGAPGEEIVVSGAISNEVVSATFRPLGPMRVPRAVALTFDDGPGPYTSRILATLRHHHVPATFFVIGIHAQQHPDVVQQEARDAMAVGNHSWDHPHRPPFARLPRARLREEIARTERLLVSMGIAPELFRPPGGSFSDRVIRAARAVDCRVALWDVDPKDWMRGRTPAQIAHAVLSSVHAGSIVELHDGGPNPMATLAALPAIIDGIRAMGLHFVTLSG